jgi:hypothetical protein
MRYGQERTELRSSKRSSARHADAVSPGPRLGVLQQAEDPVTVQLQLAAVGVRQLAKGELVAGSAAL